jgi:superfamily II DNA or RNA helicase
MAKISNLVWIKRDHFSQTQYDLLKRDLTIVPKQLGRGDETPDREIESFIENEEEIGIPFAYFDAQFPDMEIVSEELSDGHSIEVKRLPDPTHPKSPPNQKEFFDGVLEALKSHYTVLAVAPTGSGKTVCLLNSIGTLGRSAMVVVPSAVLADQWRQEAMLHLGLEWSDIGVLQGNSDNWRGKKMVIAVIHNLFLKQWPEDFYKNFGFLAWDECHRLGGEVFSKTMSMFNSRFRISVTATPNRKDGCDLLYKYYFGSPLVVAKSKALACDCYVLPFKHIGDKHKWIQKCKMDAKPMQWLSKLSVRNETIVRLAKSLYDDGYQILILSKFIEHVETIISMLEKSGVPKEDLGQFTRSTSTNKKFGAGMLDKVKKEAKIIVATYSMMKEGVDIPRLDAGIEALPSADNVQAIGRIRRPLPNKRRPKWFSILDLRIPLFEAYTKCALRGFENANVTIKHLNEGSI